MDAETEVGVIGRDVELIIKIKDGGEDVSIIYTPHQARNVAKLFFDAAAKADRG